MQRRKFLRLMGVGAAAAVVTSQLPASTMPAPSPVTIPVVHQPEPELPLACQTEAECTGEIGEHSNPYLTTTADLGLSSRPNLKKLMDQYGRIKRYEPY